jgi:hypothetical protein
MHALRATVLRVLRYRVLVAALLVLGGGEAAQAQYVGTLPKFITYKPGTYQTADAGWHAGQLYTDLGNMLRVRNPDDKRVVEYTSADVRQFVIENDTFMVVRNVDLPSRRVASAFAKHLYRCGEFSLLDYRTSPLVTGFLAPSYPNQESVLLVQPRAGAAVRVPSGRGAFEQAMLPLFGTCPEVADNIKRGKWGRQHMKNILLAYAQWQQTSNKPAE